MRDFFMSQNYEYCHFIAKHIINIIIANHELCVFATLFCCSIVSRETMVGLSRLMSFPSQAEIQANQ